MGTSDIGQRPDPRLGRCAGSASSRVRDALLSQDRHPKLDWRGDALWGTLYELCQEPEAGGDEATDLRFVLRPQFLVTARRHAVRSARAVHDQVTSVVMFDDSAAVFERILTASADSIGETAHEIAGQLDQVEDRVLSETLSDERSLLLRVRRSISRQERLVHAVQGVLGHASTSEPRLPSRRTVTWARG